MAALRKVEQLLKKGATILGPKPERLVSLVGGPDAQREFHALADKLWGADTGVPERKKVGKGLLVWGLTSRDFLSDERVLPDFEVINAEDPWDYQYIHYTVGQADVYFVCNQTDEHRQIRCSFRVSGKQPELWDPVTGGITTAEAFHQDDGRTAVPVELDPHGSCFVVFAERIPPSRQGRALSNHPAIQPNREIPGPWELFFDPAWGGPGTVEFMTLQDWTRHTEAGIVHYSGKALYRNAFDFEPEAGRRYWIQLNRVEDVGIASVALNGKELGIAWTKPFRLEMTDALISGQNHLEITVINSWLNRLIGDRGKPPEQSYTRTNIHVRDDWSLVPSGLLGPVEIYF
jgi:hypothetical protein